MKHSTLPQHSTFNIQHSLVATVKNESSNIAALLDSMLAQSRRPDEIVINDCGSSDDTAAIVERYIAAGHPIRLVRGGFNIPSGRNNAIRHARGCIIACTDAGLTLDPHWFERIIAPLEQDQADVVGGFFRPAPQSSFELALGATNYRSVEQIDPASFLPFGQSVAFRKDAWLGVGGYPEWASHCEDLLFDMALKDAGYRFIFVPDALVYFRPRESLAAFARQYYFYARGDGVAKLWTKRHIIRYTAYLSGAVLAALALRRPWIFALHVLGALGYCWAAWRRLLSGSEELGVRSEEWGVTRRQGDKQTRGMGSGEHSTFNIQHSAFAEGHSTFNIQHLILPAAYVPLIRVVGDLAKMIGYPVGIVRRLRQPTLRKKVADYWNR